MRHDGASPAEAPVASARSCLSSTAGPGLLPSGPRAHDHSPGAARGSGILRQLARALAPSVDSARARYWSCIQMSRGRPVSTQSPRDMGSAVRPSCGLGGATSSASLASPRRTPLHASGRSDRNRLGADDHPRAGDEIHPGPKEIRGEVFFPQWALTRGRPPRCPLAFAPGGRFREVGLMGNTPVDRQRRYPGRRHARAEAVAATRAQKRAGPSAPVRRLRCEAGGPAAMDRVAHGPASPERAYRFVWQEALEAWRDAHPALSLGREP